MSSNDQYPTATSKDKVFLAIAEEREAQDAQWGGPAHDDGHEWNDWHNYIAYQNDCLIDAGSDEAFRERYIKIAALAVAAIESLDRKMLQPARCPTCQSPSPHLHPAMQHEGEVQPCQDSWHSEKVYCAELGNNEHGS